MDNKRNCRKIRCSRCKKNILFSKNDIWEEDRDSYVTCENCDYDNKLKKK